MADIAATFAGNNLFNAFHDHFPKKFILIFKSFEYFLHDFDDANFIGYFHCCFNELLIISLLSCHSSNPKIVKEFLQHIFSYIISLYTIASYDLFQNFQDDFSQLLLICTELLDNCRHHTFSIFGRVLRIH